MQLLEEYFEKLLDIKDSLLSWRKQAWDRFQKIGLPSNFKDLCIPQIAECPKTTEDASAELHFVDGYFQKTSLSHPIICLSLHDAMRNYGIFLQNRWVRTLKEETDPLAALNGAFQGKGAFLYIPPHCHVKNPIEILHHLNSSHAASPRLHIYMNKNSSLTLLQHTVGASNSFCNAFIDITLDEGSELHFQETQNLESSSRYFQNFRATLKKDSKLNALFFSQGAQFVYNSTKVQLLETNSETELRGLANLTHSFQHHTHVVVDHVAPGCRSHQHFKNVLKDKSQSNFEGKILVRSAAQKTDSYQLNNNLLLSDEAWAHSKPNLKIFADDVKASHGSTTAPLNAEEIFYLRSRGLTQMEAEKWLIHGFVHELMDKAHPSVQKRLEV